MPKPASKTSKAARKKVLPPSVPYETWLIKSLKDPAEAAAYIEAAIEEGDQPTLMMALRHVAQAQGGRRENRAQIKAHARGDLPDVV